MQYFLEPNEIMPKCQKIPPVQCRIWIVFDTGRHTISHRQYQTVTGVIRNAENGWQDQNIENRSLFSGNVAGFTSSIPLLDYNVT